MIESEARDGVKVKGEIYVPVKDRFSYTLLDGISSETINICQFILVFIDLDLLDHFC